VKVLVGLGNPGKRYERTPHNVGFNVIEGLAKGLTCVLKTSFSFNARMGKVFFNGEEILLLEPQSYMNASGPVVGSILRYNKAAPTDMILVLDDADIELGRLRIRAKGSSGGHKGLESVIQNVGSEEFARVRVGIGRSNDGRNLVEHVLTPFSKSERNEVDRIVTRAAEAVLCIIESGVETAMNRFNARNVEQNVTLS
jgi:PTH1 family peptidyl-tRNA hydrolase